MARSGAVICIDALMEADLSVTHTRLILVFQLMISEFRLRALHLSHMLRQLFLAWRRFVPQSDQKLGVKAIGLVLSRRQVLIDLRCALVY